MILSQLAEVFAASPRTPAKPWVRELTRWEARHRNPPAFGPAGSPGWDAHIDAVLALVERIVPTLRPPVRLDLVQAFWTTAADRVVTERGQRVCAELVLEWCRAMPESLVTLAGPVLLAANVQEAVAAQRVLAAKVQELVAAQRDTDLETCRAEGRHWRVCTQRWQHQILPRYQRRMAGLVKRAIERGVSVSEVRDAVVDALNAVVMRFRGISSSSQRRGARTPPRPKGDDRTPYSPYAHVAVRNKINRLRPSVGLDDSETPCPDVLDHLVAQEDAARRTQQVAQEVHYLQDKARRARLLAEMCVRSAINDIVFPHPGRMQGAQQLPGTARTRLVLHLRALGMSSQSVSDRVTALGCPMTENVVNLLVSRNDKLVAERLHADPEFQSLVQTMPKLEEQAVRLGYDLPAPARQDLDALRRVIDRNGDAS